jgi:signal transduction histidine kinase
LAVLACLLLLLLPHAVLRASNRSLAPAPAGVIETGVPSFVIYGSETLGLSSPPTKLLRLPDGRLLVAAAHDIAIGDGVRWELIRHKEGDIRFIVSSVIASSTGQLYTSVREGIARIRFREDSTWEFEMQELINAESQQTLPVLGNIINTGKAWYWHSGSGPILSWRPGEHATVVGHEDAIGDIFQLGSNSYLCHANRPGIGLLSATNHQLLQLETDDPERLRVTCSLPFRENAMLLGTRSAGLGVFDGKSVVRFASEGPLAGGHAITSLCATLPGYYAAALHGYGIILFSAEGRIIDILSSRADYRFADVRSLVYTPEGVLWAVLADGVARIALPARLSSMNAMIASGVAFVEPCRADGQLWLNANGRALRAVYDENRHLERFDDLTPPGTEIWRLNTELGGLIASTQKGLLLRKRDAWERLCEEPEHLRISELTDGKGRHVYLAKGELGWISLDEGHVVLSRQPEPRIGEVYGCALDKDGSLWCELGSGSVARVNLRGGRLELTRYDGRNGIPEDWAGIFVLDGKARLSVANRILVLDDNSELFIDDTELLTRIPDMRNATGRPLRDKRGYLWIAGEDSIHIVDDSVTPARTLRNDLPITLIPYDFYLEEKGVIWMQDRRNFVRYDASIPLPPEPPLNTLITRLELPASGRTLFDPDSQSLVLPYTENSLIAHFSVPSNPFTQHVVFESKVDGLAPSWTSNGVSGNASFNRLREGNYVLHVRARTPQSTGPETLLSFTIRPPWFRTSMAYLAYAIGGVLALSAAILLPIFDERRQKQRLEQLVAERTRELRGSEERYRSLSQELERRVSHRTEELHRRIAEVERLNADLDRSSARLQEANSELQVANQELESFSYSVSHDLRAPLRNVTGFIEILRRRVYGKVDKECDRYLDIVIAEAKRLGELIDELLAFSRIGRTEMKLQPIDVCAVAEQVKGELRVGNPDRRIEWLIHPIPRILGDHFLIRQVLTNLMGNAVKFTRRQPEACIEVGALPDRNKQGQVILFVRDNGAGFNPLYADKLFKVFQRLHTNRDFEGTGIGLANVKRIVTRHGGEVWAHGETDRGATFYFSLPPAN